VDTQGRKFFIFRYVLLLGESSPKFELCENEFYVVFRIGSLNIVLCEIVVRLFAGVHLMMSNGSGSRLSYMYYSLNTLKVEQDCLFPAELQSLIGRGDNEVSLHNCGEVCVLQKHSIYVVEDV
jgi:hypothetical protein